MSAHTNLINEVLLRLSEGGVMVWKNQTGALRNAQGRLVRYGLEGSADILGVLPCGRALAVECKVGRDRLRPAQIAFRDRFLGQGGAWFEVRSVDDLSAIWPIVVAPPVSGVSMAAAHG